MRFVGTICLLMIGTVCLLMIGCEAGDVRMGWSTYGYQAGEPDWQAQRPTLNRPRAAHSVVALGAGEFLVLGGDSDADGAVVNSPVGELELNLDVERCFPNESKCQVIASLPRGVELAQVVTSPDGWVVISDGRSLMTLDLQVGSTIEMPVQAQELVATEAGIAVLGISGEKGPGNLPGPREYGIIRNSVDGMEMVAAPPEGVWVQTAAPLGEDRVLVASNTGSAILDVVSGVWTLAPALPTDAYGPVGVSVGDGAVLVHANGEQFAYLFSDSNQEWEPVPVPSTSAYVLHAIPSPDGAVFVVSDRNGLSTQSFRYSDSSWLAGPAAPPWSVLNAMTVLDSGLVISVGGADYDFVGARSAN